MGKIIAYSLLLTAYCLTLSASAFAQSSSFISGAAVNVDVADSEVQVGDVISSTSEGFKRSIEPYDSKLFGVVVESAIISMGEKGDATRTIISSGKANVRVNTANGPIKVGDFITSSQTAGAGQKAIVSGYALGKALADFDGSETGTIPVFISVGFFEPNPSGGTLAGSLFAALNAGLKAPGNFPLVLRYVSAALVAGITAFVTFFLFMRFIRSGLEAIGRNPLARNTIIAGMVVNGAIIGLLAIGGFGISVAMILL